MRKPNRGGLGKPLGWGEGWKGSHSAADSHIFFLEICPEFGGHKNFVLHRWEAAPTIDLLTAREMFVFTVFIRVYQRPSAVELHRYG
jgi:hypothetical protein